MDYNAWSSAHRDTYADEKYRAFAICETPSSYEKDHRQMNFGGATPLTHNLGSLRQVVSQPRHRRSSQEPTSRESCNLLPCRRSETRHALKPESGRTKRDVGAGFHRICRLYVPAAHFFASATRDARLTIRLWLTVLLHLCARPGGQRAARSESLL